MPYLPLLVLAGLALFGAVTQRVSPYVGAGYLLASLLCFAVYARDKSAARNSTRRTPESALLLLGLAGGWPGAVLAQQWLRHKSSKPSFRWRFHVTVALNLLCLGWLMI